MNNNILKNFLERDRKISSLDKDLEKENIPEEIKIAHPLDYYFSNGIRSVEKLSLDRKELAYVKDKKILYDHRKKCLYSSLVTLLKKRFVKDRTVMSLAEFSKIDDVFQSLNLSSGREDTIDMLKSLADMEYALYGKYNKFNPISMSNSDVTYISLIFRQQSSRLSKGNLVYEIIDYGQIQKMVISSFIDKHSRLYKNGKNGYPGYRKN